MNKLLLSFILSFLPVSELRGGLPVAISYALDEGIPILFVFIPVVLINILAAVFVFIFLEFLHVHFLKIKLYEKLFGVFIRKVRKRADKVERNLPDYGYLALTIFVAIPLPVTGAWTGTAIAWLLGLEKKKSLAAISLGVFIAGLAVLTLTLGIFNGLS